MPESELLRNVTIRRRRGYRHVALADWNYVLEQLAGCLSLLLSEQDTRAVQQLLQSLIGWMEQRGRGW